MNASHKWLMEHRFLSFTLGFTTCVAASGLLAVLLRQSDMRRFGPVVVLLLAALAARFFGSAGVALGVTAAALIFASNLFTPVGSFNIEHTAERNSVVLLLTLGVPAAYFLGTGKDKPTLK